MALKRKINKSTFEKLSEELKKEYKAGSSDDEFILDTEGDEDTGALRRALERERENASTSKKRLAELETELEELNSSDARKKGDIKTLETSWNKKLESQKNEYEAKVSKLTSHVQKTLVDNVANDIAHRISKAPALLLPHIRSRIVADLDGDEPTTKILGADGKVSAMTVADLEKEFVGNKDFAAIIVASKASGGAGNQPSNKFGGGAPTNTHSQQPADLSKQSPQALAEMLKANRQA
jgi:hypothetical protein